MGKVNLREVGQSHTIANVRREDEVKMKWGAQFGESA